MATSPKKASPNVWTGAEATGKTADVSRFAVVASETADVGRFAMTTEVTAFALGLGIDLTGSLDERANLAAEHMNRSQRHMLASGLLLASIKAECEHGQFMELIEARGFEERAARKSMQYAQFIMSQSEPDRLRLIELPRSKVMEIAGADPEVIEQLLQAEDGQSIDALSVRALRARIQELEANTVDLQVQRDTAETEAEGLRKKLKRGLPERADQVPHVVADLRAEIVALGRKAQLAIDSFKPLGTEVVSLGAAGAQDWMDATLRLAASQLAALGFQIEGVLTMYLDQLPDRDPRPVKLSELTKAEVLEAAQACATLTQAHQYEAALREWQREQDRPRGKGRPKDKPVPPPGVEGGAA